MQQKKNAIAIIDYGSQYTLLILKKLSAQGYFSVIFANKITNLPDTHNWKGIILSGGPGSLKSFEGRCDANSFIWQRKLPVLGICYGLQLIVNHFGGKVNLENQSEFGRSKILLEQGFCEDQLFKKSFHASSVWMSHSDSVNKLPDELIQIASSSSGAVAALKHQTKNIFALQFHPEVDHTECGKDILHNFAANICELEENLCSQSFIKDILFSIKQEVKEGKVLIGVSGGVDSSVTAVLLTKVLKRENIFAVLIDHGFMRKNEVENVKNDLLSAGVNIEIIDASQRFLENLGTESDPELKRKIIGKTFIECFEEFAKSCHGITHLVQGTLYPDVIESSYDGSNAKVIKSHHNVGGLPEKLTLKLIEPFKFCFKNEVRKIGKELGLASNLLNRHPFPGPGLSVRIPGAISKRKLDILKAADHVFISALRTDNLYDSCWQAGVVLLPIKSVGVMGDNRTYEFACSLRAVSTEDGMTAEAVDLPISFLRKVASNIINEVPGINRVLYDVTSKPPATIEWE